MKATSKEIYTSLFTPLGDDDPHVHKCKICDKDVRQNLKSGYKNLLNHLDRHPEVEKIVSGVLDIKMCKLFDMKTVNIHGWIDWIVMEMLPISFCEKERTLKYTSLRPVSRKSMTTYITNLTKQVELVIRGLLPDKFGLVFDGWSKNSIHYVALYAVFGPTKRQILLTFSPFQDEYDLSSESIKGFITDTVIHYGKSLDNIQFLVGDNCPANAKAARLLDKPLIGCASHKLNLAMKTVLLEYETTIDDIHSIMKKLKTYKGKAKLSTVCDLSAITRNDTRWSSVYNMVSRFLTILPNIRELSHRDMSSLNIINLLPSPSEEQKIQPLATMLEDFESAVKLLQRESTTLLCVRDVFDTCIEDYPITVKYLADDARIVQNPIFEQGIIALQKKGTPTTSDVITSLQCFVRPEATLTEAQPVGERISLAEKALKRRKVVTSDWWKSYMDVTFIPPTSNVCERFFSQAKLVYTDLRNRLNPETLEALLFLKTNRDLWNEVIVYKALNDNNN